MSKKLLAAALAAAFLVTGGVAVGGEEYNFVRNSGDSADEWVNGTGTAHSTQPGDIIADGDAVGVFSAHVTSGGKAATNNPSVDSLQVKNDGIMYVGMTSGGVAPDSTTYTSKALELTADSITVTKGALNIAEAYGGGGAITTELKIKEASEIGVDGEVNVGGTLTLTNNTTVGSVLTNNGQLIVSGKLDNSDNTATNQGSMIVNTVTGYIKFEDGSTYDGKSANGRGIDNSAATGYDASDATKKYLGLHVDLGTTDNDKIFDDVLKGGDDGAGAVNVGDIIVTSATTGKLSGGKLDMSTATAGRMFFGGDLNGQGVDMGKADLTITSDATSTETNGKTGALVGGNVTLNKATATSGANKFVYDGAITADTSNAQGGIVTLDADGAIELNNTITANKLDVQSNGTLNDGAVFASAANINIADKVTLTNKNTASNELDVSGKKITGKGTLDNSTVDGAKLNLTLGSTGSIDDTVSIVNASKVGAGAKTTGTITTDETGLAELAASQFTGTVGTTVYTMGNVDHTGNISTVYEKDAVAGETFTWKDSGTAAAVKKDGVVDIGAGTFKVESNAGSGTRTIEEGASLTAGVLDVDKALANAGTVVAGLDLAAKVTNTGSITSGTTVDNTKVDVTGGIDNTKGTLVFGDKSVVTAAADKIDVSKDSNITIDGGMLAGNAKNLTDAIKDTASNIGTVSFINETVKDDIDLSKATGGTVNYDATQTGKKNANVGLADLNINGDDNDMGALTGGNVYLNSEEVGSSYGAILAREGNVTSLADADFTGTVTAREKAGDTTGATGNIDLTGASIVGKVDADNTIALTDSEANGAVESQKGDIYLTNSDANSTVETKVGDIYLDNTDVVGKVISADDITITNGGTFDDTVTATGTINAQDAIFNQMVSADKIEGDGNAFLNGITTLNGMIIGPGKEGMLSGPINSTVTTKNGGTLIIGGPNDADIQKLVTMEDGSTMLFADATHKITNNTGTGSIDMTDGMSLVVADDVRNVVDKPLWDANTLSATKFNKENVITRDPVTGDVVVNGKFEEYLDYESIYTFGDQGVYTVENGQLVYNHRDLTEAEYDDGFRTVMRRQGLEGYEDMVSESSKELQRYYSDPTNDLTANGDKYADLTGDDLYLATLIKSAAGNHTLYDLRNDHAGAYALEQWKNGADWAGATEAVMDTARAFNRAITNRAYNIGHLMNQVEYDECGNVIASCGGFKNRIWAGYTGQWDKLDDRGWDKGYKYDAHGFNIGYDHVTSSGIGFGAAFGYSKGDYENLGQLYGEKSKIDNYSWGLFASYNHASGFFTTISGTYTYSKYKMRNGFADAFTTAGGDRFGAGFDRADYHGDTWSIGGKIGYDIKPVANLTITPTLGLYHYYGRTNNFNSTYREGMKYSRRTLEMPLDVTVKYDIAVGCDSTLSLVGTAGYAYNFHNKGTKINGFAMGNELVGQFGDYNMTKPGRSSWNVGGGAQFRYRNFDVGVHYEYYGRKDFRSHSLNANVGYSF